MDFFLCMAARLKPVALTFGQVSRILFLSSLAVLGAPLAAAHADILGVSVGVGIGGSSGIGASVGIGLGGSTGTGGTSMSGVSAGVGVGTGTAGTGGVSANVGVGIGGADVDVDVSLGGAGATGTGGTPGTGTPGTGGPATGPVDPAMVNSDPSALAKARRMLAGMTCAKGGNSQVYNGFSVLDRSGRMVGWVHDANLTSKLKITGVQMQTIKNTCVSLNGGSYAVNGASVVVNMDGSRFR